MRASVQARGLRVDPVLVALSRRWARLPASGQLRVKIPDLPVDLRLRDLSFGGFAVATSRPFWKGMTHRFMFATRSGESMTLVAKAVHCQQEPNGGAFVTGWEFMRGSAERTEAAIGRLLDTVAQSSPPHPYPLPRSGGEGIS